MAEFNISRFKYIWKGVWQSGRTFSKDDIAAVGGKAYVCLIGHIASAVSFDEDLNAVNQFGNPEPRWELLADGTKWTGVWQANFKYNQNELVKDGATIYRCIVGHTSDPLTINGLAADLEKWEFVARTVQWRDAWVAERKYRIGDLVSYNGQTFSAIVEHVSGTLSEGLESNISNWEIVNVSDQWTNEWASGIRYRPYDTVLYGGITYRCLTGHTSSEVSLEIDQSNWEIVSSSTSYRSAWETNTLYYQNDIVILNNVTYKSLSTHTSGDNFDTQFWNIYIPGLAFENEWQVDIVYQIGDVVKYGGYSYISTSNNNTSQPPEEWSLLNTGYKFKQEWIRSTTYETGDVVEFGGNLYVATENSYGAYPVYSRESIIYDITVESGAEGPINYLIDGSPLPDKLYLETGTEYIFVQNDNTNINNELYFSNNPDGHHDSNYDFVQGNITYYLDFIPVTASEYINGFTGTTDRRIIIDFASTTDNNKTFYMVNNQTSGFTLGKEVVSSKSNVWSQITDSSKFKGSWFEDEEYYPGDIATFQGQPYKCLQLHSADTSSLTSPELDDGSYWELLIQGSASNRLTNIGDIKTATDLGSGVESTNLKTGISGNILNANDGINVAWLGFDNNPNVFYVAPNGLDSETAGSKAQPFASIKFACDFILSDTLSYTPATIFVATGSYQEELPIVVPKDVAIVGDELRSTTIKPAPGYETTDMFYMRNGSGLRNCTLQGLTGTLGPQNVYFTKRPDGGAYVSLDPGTGPSDQEAWIINKSPYVQNVTTFGTGCVGLKIDGDLHAGGNKSIVANDFTQVLSDGIGVWVNADARSELVSVFSYYNHIGYLAENGGTIRATNGNSSYGDYGCVAEGFLQAEEPITAKTTNRAEDASIGFTYITDGNISALGYSNAGQNYTNAQYSISGSGFGEQLTIGDTRYNGIFELRMLQADDSTNYKGAGWTFVSNFSQGGDSTTITIAGNDEVEDPARYIGQTLFISDGPGSGQYGIISDYNTSTKVATISTPDGLPGFTHVQPGRLPVSIGDNSRYFIEPTFAADEPEFLTESFSTGSFKQIGCAAITPNVTVVCPIGGDVGAYSDDGNTWLNMNLPVSANYIDTSFDGEYIWVLASNGTVARTLNGSNWTYYNLAEGSSYSKILITPTVKVILRADSPNVYYTTNSAATSDDWSETTLTLTNGTGLDFITHDGDLIIIGNKEGDMFTSFDGGNWTPAADPTESGVYELTDIVAGSNVLVAALQAVDGVSTSIYKTTLLSDFNNTGFVWNTASNAKTNSVLDTSINKFYLTYQGGLFFAISETGSINTSQDAFNWLARTPEPGTYIGATSGINSKQRFFGINNTLSSSVKFIQAGARVVARPIVVTNRIERFLITEPGSGYDEAPFIEINDNGKIVDVTLQPRIGQQVLAHPRFISHGEDYITASATITGDGFKDEFPVGQLIYVEELNRLPGPGDTFEVNGITESFSIQKISNITGSDGNFSALLQIAPSIGITESPEHNTTVTIRQRYSQVRMTGHDFLDVGTGNFSDTAYPTLYNFGYDFGENNPKPNQEVVFGGGGRVFYTSTDQDGNFRVGELFEVEQASGIVTISATQFNLEGLEELRLGGIVLGGSNAVIREFSTDPTFIANSNEIVPTQKAIASYIANRISSGGSRIFVNTTIAGNIVVSGEGISNRAGNIIDVEVPANLKRGATGSFLALQLFTK